MKSMKKQFIVDAVLGVVALIMLMLVIATVARADKPPCPPAESCNNPPPKPDEEKPPVFVTVEAPPVYVTVEKCDEYQVRVLTVRGNNAVATETLGYCDIGAAQNAITRINAMPFIKFPKGLPIRQAAFPLF